MHDDRDTTGTDQTWAVLGLFVAIIPAAVAQNFLPNTPAGHALSFIVMLAAYYPFVRKAWRSNTPLWRYWAILGAGAIGGFIIETFRSRWTHEMNVRGAVVTYGLIGIGLVYAVWRKRRSSRSSRN